jgi:6-phosphofructokinase 2
VPVYTVTLNPAVDHYVEIGHLDLGETNRVRHSEFDVGGKGVNVSRVLHRLGHDTVAVAFVAGRAGDVVERALAREGVPARLIEGPGETRTNVSFRERDTGRQTSLNERGAEVPPALLDRLRDVLREIPPGGVAVLAGSVPPGPPPEVYRNLVTELRARGVRTVVDTSGEALAAALEARPALIKPNDEEAGDLIGRRLETEEDVMAAGRELRDRGPEIVVISMGGRGALAFTPEGVYRAVPPSVEKKSTVGSGDSMVAGLALALQPEAMPFPEALRLGTAAGAATAMTPGTDLCERDDVLRLLDEVRVERVG